MNKEIAALKRKMYLVSSPPAKHTVAVLWCGIMCVVHTPTAHCFQEDNGAIALMMDSGGSLYVMHALTNTKVSWTFSIFTPTWRFFCCLFSKPLAMLSCVY